MQQQLARMRLRHVPPRVLGSYEQHQAHHMLRLTSRLKQFLQHRDAHASRWPARCCTREHQKALLPWIASKDVICSLSDSYNTVMQNLEFEGWHLRPEVTHYH